MLSDQDIMRALNVGTLEIEPISNLDLQLQPCSVDLTLGNTFIVPGLLLNFTDGRAKTQIDRKIEVPEDSFYEIYPGDFILASTRERVKLSNSLAARAEGRSSIGRLGLFIHVTAGFIDPGYNGTITLELFNASKSTIVLSPGMRICQLALFELSSPSERPYGAERGSKYVGDQTGPEVSRIQKDQK